jgi:tetratricopeptide (TPR) repeat protein
MYVPLMALAVLAVLGVAAAARALSGGTAAGLRTARATTAVVVVAAVAGMSALTLQRTTEYASPLTLARTVVERRPTALAHHLLGEQLGLAGDRAEAEKELRAAVALGDSRARYQLGLLLMDGQRVAEAGPELEAFVATAGVPQRLRWLEPPLVDVLSARLQLSQVYGLQRRWADAAAQARLVLDVAPRHPEALRLLGIALLGAQVWPETITVLRDYLALRPADAQARSNLAVALIGAGRLDEAVGELRRAVQSDPNDANARRLLSMALGDQQAGRAPR